MAKDLAMQFRKDITKKVQNEVVSKMGAKMERAALKTVAKADELREFHDVTGNLYKSIAVGLTYQGTVQEVYHTPGPQPTRRTLAKGERYDKSKYYNGMDVTILGRPYKGEYGSGGQDGESAAEDELFSKDTGRVGRGERIWQLRIVAGVSYAGFVEKRKGLSVISDLVQYVHRYFKRM